MVSGTSPSNPMKVYPVISQSGMTMVSPKRYASVASIPLRLKVTVYSTCEMELSTTSIWVTISSSVSIMKGRTAMRSSVEAISAMLTGMSF